MRAELEVAVAMAFDLQQQHASSKQKQKQKGSEGGERFMKEEETRSEEFMKEEADSRIGHPESSGADVEKKALEPDATKAEKEVELNRAARAELDAVRSSLAADLDAAQADLDASRSDLAAAQADLTRFHRVLL